MEFTEFSTFRIIVSLKSHEIAEKRFYCYQFTKWYSPQRLLKYSVIIM